MIRAEVRPELLRWARERTGFSVGALTPRFPHLEARERGEARPTLNRLESFAKATYALYGLEALPGVNGSREGCSLGERSS